MRMKTPRFARPLLITALALAVPLTAVGALSWLMAPQGTYVSTDTQAAGLLERRTSPIDGLEVRVTDDLQVNGRRVRGYVNIFSEEPVIFVAFPETFASFGAYNDTLSHELGHVYQRAIIRDRAQSTFGQLIVLIQLDQALRAVSPQTAGFQLFAGLEANASCGAATLTRNLQKDYYLSNPCDARGKAAAKVVQQGLWPTLEAVEGQLALDSFPPARSMPSCTSVRQAVC